MANPAVLIVFYTRSGSTERIAFEIARDVAKLGVRCDVEPLDETVRRRHGPLGYLRTGRDALLGRPAQLRPIRRDPSDYDLVVVGTPVWAASVSTPVRSFLEEHRADISQLAVFLTHGGTGQRRVLRQVSRLATRDAVANLAIRERDLVCEIHQADVKEFVVHLAAALGVLPRAVATRRRPLAESADAYA